MDFKNFINKISGSNRIFSREEIGELSMNDFKGLESVLDFQIAKIGAPPSSALDKNSGVIYINDYTKDDGTKVKAHYRSLPNGNSTISLEKNLSENNIQENLSVIENNIKNTVKKASKDFKKSAAYAFNNKLNSYNNEAKELMNIALDGLDNTKKQDHFDIIDKNESKIINNVFSLKSPSLKIEEGWQGVRFKENSDLNKKLSKSPELQNQIKNYYKKHKNMSTKDKITGLNFTYEKDRNLAYAIGHFTVLNPNVNKNGEFTGLLYDKYDFEPMKYNNKYTNNITTFLNNRAVDLHNSGQLEYYYLLAPIKFKIDD